MKLLATLALLLCISGARAKTVSVADCGGVPDGVTSNTEAFEKAVKAVVKAGGGQVVVPAGVWLTGPIVLKSGVDLHLEKNAIIVMSPVKSEFLKDGKVVPGIRASKAKDVSITGEGIIDGNGEWWRGVKRGKVSDTEWNAFKKMGGTVEDGGKIWYPFNLKNTENIAETAKAQEKMRTHLIRFTDCEGVRVSGVTVQNSPKFHIVPQRCKDVVIENVTVRCPWNAQNGDGIDIMQCKDVKITGCTVDVGDDGICLKAGGGEKALEAGPCENILIEGNTVFHAHGGFVIGSEFSGGMKNITVRNNTFCGTDTGLRFKSGAGRGGKTEGIVISDIYMTDIKDQAIVFETGYADRPVGRENEVKEPSGTDFLPDFQDIRISRVTCRGTAVAIRAGGTPAMVHDISVSDCVFFYTDAATEIDDPSMITLTNVRFETF